jgi:hypothetical protein
MRARVCVCVRQPRPRVDSRVPPALGCRHHGIQEIPFHPLSPGRHLPALLTPPTPPDGPSKGSDAIPCSFSNGERLFSLESIYLVSDLYGK